MKRYLETAAKLKTEVDAFFANHIDESNAAEEAEAKKIAVALAHIINLTIRCTPRGVQHTVRKNIVDKALEDRCDVTMTEVPKDNGDGTYHKIHIEAAVKRS